MGDAREGFISWHFHAKIKHALCLITPPDQVNALFIHCNMRIHVYFTALYARYPSVEHCALPLLCSWTQFFGLHVLIVVLVTVLTPS